MTDLAGATYDEVFVVSLTDADEFNVTAPTDVDATADAVDENSAIGTVVGITASASDADATTNTVTYSLFDNDSGNFAIDSNTGVVTVAAALNRETLGGTRSITVRATSADGSFTDQAFTDQAFSIAINDLDEFNVTTPIDVDATSNAVDENAASGTLVGIVALASDADSTTNAVTYSLQDSDSGRFSIDTNTGVVTVAAALDREVLGVTRNITVRATSADGRFWHRFICRALNYSDQRKHNGDGAFDFRDKIAEWFQRKSRLHQ